MIRRNRSSEVCRETAGAIFTVRPEPRFFFILRSGLATVAVVAGAGWLSAQEARPQAAPPERALIRRFCVDCHNRDEKTAGLALDTMSEVEVGSHAETWEKVVRKLRARQMPPADMPRPSEEEYDAALASLEGALDRLAAEHPNPGRTGTFRRLNRTEYQNAIRDLLAIELDVADLVPADESSHGFDNVTVEDLSPTLLDRYLTSAQKIAALAVGNPRLTGDTFRVRPDVTQEEHVPGLPIGTRGGTLISYYFPQDGQYEIQVRLARDRNEEVEGLNEPHQVEVLLDRRRVAQFTVQPPKDNNHAAVDRHLHVRIQVAAGPHKLGVTFPKRSSSLLETRRQPYHAQFNMHRHPRQSPAVYQVSIVGPYEPKGPGDTPSRRRIFVCRPSASEDEEACARQILGELLRRAYRRPVTDEDLAQPLGLFREARSGADFDAGVALALSAVLASPHFLFRVERDPPDAAPGSVYRLSDFELASRLSFFLWSSIPDDEVLDLAEGGELGKPDVLRAQARRMLADKRSQSLASNFAGQWLHLRNLDSITPDLRLFPDFDDNLRQALRKESELLFESVARENRSVLDLLRANDTFLNERLAKHYGIEHIYGSRFRRVAVADDTHRGGLLRHGSILTVTSYATRTSPVIRGKWILANFLGTPPPPPLPNVPALKDNTVDSTLSVRERLAQHRANEACASCHNLMDPVGFALENFDAVGRWRTLDEGRPIDASGGLPDGSTFTGVDGLERALLRRQELFVATLAEKLLIFALGRGIEPYDGPAIRQIVRDARKDDYRFSSLIEGIVTSTPFTMRRTP
jgi:cytochrome c553